jgi:serine/threonine-protein kinase
VEELDEATGTLPAGFEFGAYVIGGCIGQGGMARIYRAEHRALRKPVALKVMDAALLQRPEGRHRFLREGQAAAAVKHPNVVDITDVGVWQGRPYLVMELLEGEDLEQYLSRHRPLAEAEAARLMIPVIAGLATAHESGVIHRDLKPSNVFLARGPDGELVPKLLDFGISKLSTSIENLDPSSTPLGELMGSPMYMSPEAVRGARDLTPQSDQYSLGVVLYECVTGRAPFQGDSLLAVLEAVAHGTFDPPRQHRPDLSRTLEMAILRAMNPEPLERFENMRELGRALCQAADHRTRLLWTPSFGMPDGLESKTTAVLGPSPLRTGAPFSASVPVPQARSIGHRARQFAAAAVGAVIVLGVGLAIHFGRGMVRAEPVGEALESAATLRSLQPPAEVLAGRPLPELLPLPAPPVPAAAPAWAPAAPGRALPTTPAPETKPRSSRRDVPRTDPGAGSGAQRRAAAEPRPPVPVAPPLVSKPAAPARPSKAPLLGANQAPILD